MSVYVSMSVCLCFQAGLKNKPENKFKSLNKISSLSFKGPDMWQQIMLEKRIWNLKVRPHSHPARPATMPYPPHFIWLKFHPK